MRVGEYLRDKVVFIFINIMALTFTVVLLNALSIGAYAIFFIILINFIASSLFYIFDYFKKKKYYKEIFDNLKNLDKKYLIVEMLEEESFIESGILKEIVIQSNKSMSDEVAKHRNSSIEYKDYIERWVHEIKTPIAISKLIIDNNSSDELESIDTELDRIENYIEQALFYARSDNANEDYIIKKMKLRSVVSSVLKRNMNVCIDRQIKINMDFEDTVVYSDSKWVEFIINQIVGNSIKYMNGQVKEITFNLDQRDNNIVFEIKDNGVGIPRSDIKRVFEKGYTGENGRKFGKSTGIGLYICKKLCDRLGTQICIKSEEEKGTSVFLNFPIGSMVTFENSNVTKV